MRVMRKIFIAALFVFSLLVAGRSAFAQVSNNMIVPPSGDGPSELFGQNQWYSVVFRGNGEAIVSLRVLFTNTQSSPMNILSLRVPKVIPNDLLAFQVLRQGACLRYEPVVQTQSNERTTIYPSRPQLKCLEYNEPDLYSWYGPAKYQKTRVAYSGDTITIPLPQPIQPDKSGGVLLYYRAFGYAKKSLIGSYHFIFETLQAEDPIRQLQVGISTDSDLVLRGAKGNVNYHFEDVSMAAKGMADMAAPMTNTRLDSYYQQIGQGEIVKTASNLQVLESYTVKGAYADNAVKLYAKEISIGIGITLLIIIGLVWMVRLLMKTNSKPQTMKTANDQYIGIILCCTFSFISAFMMIAVGIMLWYVMRNINSMVDYQIAPLVAILILLLSLGIFGFLLVAPSFFVGVKRGWSFGLATTGLTIMWLFIGLILVLLLFGRNTDIPTSRILHMTGNGMMQNSNSSTTTTESPPVD